MFAAWEVGRFEYAGGFRFERFAGFVDLENVFTKGDNGRRLLRENFGAVAVDLVLPTEGATVNGYLLAGIALTFASVGLAVMRRRGGQA